MTTTKKRFLGILFGFALALGLGLLPGVAKTAYAETTWDGNQTITADTEINDNINVTSNNITVTIAQDVTLTSK